MSLPTVVFALPAIFSALALSCGAGSSSLAQEQGAEGTRFPTSASAALTSSPTPAPEKTVNLIAYVDLEGRINTATPDGSETTVISPDEGFFTWPMWSPDGRQIVFSGVRTGQNGDRALRMYLYRLEDTQASIVFTNEPGMGPILPGMPHYPLWSPDGIHLTIMAAHPDGLTLFMIEPGSGGGAEVVIIRQPLYASWSADSGHLLVHGGADHFLVEVGEETAVEDMGTRTLAYRVPEWWPSGDQIVVAAPDEVGEQGLYISDVDLVYRTRLSGLGDEAAFLWSPDGRSLALAHSQLPGSGVYDGVTLYSPQGAALPERIEESVVAFFWSPDGSRLAYVTFAENREALRWMELDVAEGTHRKLADFVPSSAQMTLFRFFDQFAHSHTPWSPDSDALVFAGRMFGGDAPASDDPQVFVLNAGAGPSVKAIGVGLLAVWSPR